MKVCFIGTKHAAGVSIDKVFREISKNLDERTTKTMFQKLPFGNTFSEIVKNLVYFRVNPNSADIFHITGHIHYIALVLPKNKTVLTVHDLNILHQKSGIRRFIIKKLFFDLPFRKLNYITAISDATKSEILKLTKCDENKIQVIYNPTFELETNLEPKTFNSECPTILQVGTAPHKNLRNVIKALETITCHLRIIGTLDSETIELLRRYKIDYSNVFDLDTPQIEAEYNKSDIITFCSTYEGFGLPILEGQIAGKPMVTSNLSPMKEIAGNAAHLVNPLDSASINNGVLKIIGDPDYRNELVVNGFENIKRFEPAKITEQYQGLYDLITENALDQNV
jgi:glycosyltransferase involved in cell wall biosynthesis